MNSLNPPESTPRRRRASAFVLCLLGALALTGTFFVWRAMDRAQAAAELRKMGFEAGSESIIQLMRTRRWRDIFSAKRTEWDGRARLLYGSVTDLTSSEDALARFRPREMLFGMCAKLQDVSMLRRFPDLERLDFYDCPAVEDLGIVSEFTKVKELTFLNSPSLRSLGIIRSGKALTSLHISQCNSLTDMAALREFTSLRSLFLARCPVVKDTEPLRGLSSLEELDLSFCKELTSLDGLRGLKALKFVNLQGCSKLSPQDVAALRAALPQARIDFP